MDALRRLARHPWGYLALIFAVWRGALFCLVGLSRDLIPDRMPNPNKDYVAFEDNRLLDSFARWDSGWYDRIVRRGYYLQPGQNDTAFFPAYPYLTRWVAAGLGNHWIAGLLVSNLALFGGLWFIYRISRRYLADHDARRAALFVLAFPTSIFFSAFYSEALFLFAVAAAFFGYEYQRPIMAGCFGGLAALTRTTGILLWPAFALGALHRRRWALRPLRRHLREQLSFLLIPAGLLGVMWIQYAAVGDPLSFFKAQSSWGRSSFVFPLYTIYRMAQLAGSTPAQAFVWLDLAAAVFLFGVVGLALTRLDTAHFTFAALSLLVPLSTGKVMSVARFAACVVPVYPVLALQTRSPTLDRSSLYVSTLFSALHAVLFANWYWAG